MSPSRTPLPPRRRRTSMRDFFTTYKYHLWAFGVLFVVLCTYISVSYVSHSEALRIKSVEVTGTTLVKKEEVLARVHKILAGTRWGSIAKNTLYTMPRAAIERDILDTYTQIASVEIGREFIANKLTITVTEHQIYAAWCAIGSDSCYYINRDGYIFGPAQYDPARTRWYSDMSNDPLQASIGGDYMQTMVALVDGLQAKGISVPSVEIEAEGKELRISVAPSNESWYIRTRTDVPATDTLRYIFAGLVSKDVTAIRGELEYIDARFGNRLFYKAKPTEKEMVIED